MRHDGCAILKAIIPENPAARLPKFFCLSEAGCIRCMPTDTYSGNDEKQVKSLPEENEVVRQTR